jgi:hypothetical protein
MKLAPEDLAVSTEDLEEILGAGDPVLNDVEMGTYTNLIKGQRDKDL